MSLITWIETIFRGDPTAVRLDATEYWDIASNLYVRKLAFESAINLISNAVSKCNIKTYSKGKEVESLEWYLWNVEPNQNQSSSVFIKKLISKLYKNNESLVIETYDKQLLVADSFTTEVRAVKEYLFKNVVVDGYEFRSTFRMKDVLYYKLNNEDVAKLVEGMYSSYGKLSAYAQTAYMKSRGRKGILKMNTRVSGAKDYEEKLRQMMETKFKPYFDADSAVLPLPDGYEYNEQERKSYNADSTRDIRALIDDAFVFTARAFGIPPALLIGEVADTSKTVEAMLTFCVDPLCDLIEEENNRKRYGRKEVLAGSMQKIDTKQIKHVDLLSVSTSVEKLIGSGAWSINEVREIAGDKPIDEEWANQHFMTKNYATVEEMLSSINKE